jgi:hypothetical protein
MSVARDFYETQALACEQSAAETALPMLRDKFESAGRAWRALATREHLVEETRNRREAAMAADMAAKA